MVDAFGTGFGLALAAGVVLAASPAQARDELPPPPPCPLNATLRVADAASLAGLQSLSQCTGVIIAPARPGETPPPSDRRIAPDEGDGSDGNRASFHLASAAGASAPRKSRFLTAAPAEGPMQVAAIAPQVDEPVTLETALPAVGGESILAMRPVSYATRYDAMIGRVAARHRIDPLLLHAVIDQESRYQATATSRVGARGLMQLMPGTARMLNVHGTAIVDAEANVDGGARLLRQLHGRFNDFSLTLAAYNAGEGAVRKYGNRIPPYRETQDYVRKVLSKYEKLVAEQAAGVR